MWFVSNVEFSAYGPLRSRASLQSTSLEVEAGILAGAL